MIVDLLKASRVPQESTEQSARFGGALQALEG